MEAAYKTDTGVFVLGSTMYVAGTKSAGDVVKDLLISLGMTNFSSRYQAARAAMNPGVKTVVGHSLGGSVALHLAGDYDVQAVTYGAPVVSNTPGVRFRHAWDPISILDRGASSSTARGWNPHAYP